MKRISRRPTLLLVLLAALLALPVSAGSRIEREFDLPPGGEFELDTDVGSVVVTGTGRSGARVLITSRIDDLDSRFELSSTVEGNRVEVKLEKIGSHKAFSWLNWGRGANLEIEIEVPHDTEVSIDTSGGSITARDLRAKVLLDTSGGSIVAESIGGDVEADTSGGSIVVTDADGDVNADTSGGSITVEGVRGDVSADTSGGSIVIDDVSGDVLADTSGGSIRIRSVGGEVRADTSGGTVDVEFDRGNSKGGYLSTSGGGVRVRIDAGANLDLDAEASGGSVTCDVPVTVQGKITKSRVVGRIGSGGPELKLRASGGKIHISSR